LARAIFLNRVRIGRLAEQVDRDHAHRAQALALRGFDAGLEAGRVHVERVLEHVDEDGRRVIPGDDLRGRGEGEGRAQDRIARLDAQRHQAEAERVGAVGAGQYVLGAAERRQLLLQFGHLGAHDVLAVVDDAQHGFVHALADPAPLGAEVDEFDGSGLGAGIRHS
jgi:hypothetical protein